MTYPKVSTDPTSDANNGRGAVPGSPRFPEIEERVLAYWAEDDTFRASVEQRDPGANGENEFVFYDGPPFANGLPHYGHLLTGYAKDLVGALPDPCAASAWSAASAGTPTACPPSSKR